jgi:glutathione S-transferase
VEKSVKLYYSPNLNPRVAVAAARYLDAPVEYIRAMPRHPDHQEAFRPINPNTLVPVLVEGDRTLWETDAIVCRLSALTGSNFWRTGDEQPEMIMWISWGTHHLTKAADPIYFDRVVLPTFTSERLSPRLIEKSLRDFREHAQVLNALLTDRKWLVGEHVSYADFRVATSLPFADAAGLPIGEFPEICRWHDQLLAMDAWRDPFQGLSA